MRRQGVPEMILTVFRSRLNSGHDAEYEAFVQSTSALAEKLPGFLGHKMFFAPDGERVTLVEFESLESQRAWSLSEEHRSAAKAGRKSFYETYRIQVCEVLRDSTFVRQDPGQTPAPRKLTCPYRTAA
jgi:heme-degrading monooxygenase HmoA